MGAAILVLGVIRDSIAPEARVVAQQRSLDFIAAMAESGIATSDELMR